MRAGAGRSVIKGQRMLVRAKWAQFMRQAGWHRRIFHPVPARNLLWDRIFSVPPTQKGEPTMTTQNIPYKIYLNENEMPTAWYNLRADMKNKPAPC